MKTKYKIIILFILGILSIICLNNLLWGYPKYYSVKNNILIIKQGMTMSEVEGIMGVPTIKIKDDSTEQWLYYAPPIVSIKPTIEFDNSTKKVK